jgi:hypothetical protein
VSAVAIIVLRITQVAFGICALAAIVDNVMPVAFVAGLLAVFVGCLIAWSRWDAKMRKWDSEYPRPADANDVETLDEVADEPSRTRRIVRARDADKRRSA